MRVTVEGYGRTNFENGMGVKSKEVTLSWRRRKGGSMKSWGMALNAVDTQGVTCSVTGMFQGRTETSMAKGT